MTAGEARGPVYPFNGLLPRVSDGVFIAPTAAIIGAVTIGAGSSVWFSAVVRGDDMPIVIGSNVNVQDGAVIHGTEGVSETIVGDNVTVGHSATLHGCTIDSGAMVGIGAIVLDGARVGKGAIVAAGSLVPPGKVVPPGMLWMNGSVRRAVNDAELAFLTYAPRHYRAQADRYLQEVGR